MQVFTCSQARQKLSAVRDLAQNEEVRIRRKDGRLYSVLSRPEPQASPFDVPGVATAATTEDVLAAVRDSRAVRGDHQRPGRKIVRGGTPRERPVWATRMQVFA